MTKKNNFKKPSLQQSSRFQINEDPIDYGKSKPIFSFFNMRHGKKYCLSKCGPQEKSDLATLLLGLSQQTWNDIVSTHRKSFGFEHIPIKRFRTTIFPDIVTPDVRSLLVFAYSHGGRVAGLQQDNVFHILLVGNNLYDH